EGAKCDIYVGNDRQMAGVIDDVDVSIDRASARLNVSGRDLAAYLVDCEAHKNVVKEHKPRNPKTTKPESTKPKPVDKNPIGTLLKAIQVGLLPTAAELAAEKNPPAAPLAKVHHPQRSKPLNIKDLIELLLEPEFGIRNVITTNEDNRTLLRGKQDKRPPSARPPAFLAPIARARTKVDPGQRIASIIDEHCKRLNITWWMTAEGDLFIGKP